MQKSKRKLKPKYQKILIQDNDIKIDELEDFILQWNTDFPIDRWWRKTHKVAFNSSGHREASFLDMTFEFLEEKLYADAVERHLKREYDPYKPGIGNFLYPRKTEQVLSDEAFDNINLDDMD